MSELSRLRWQCRRGTRELDFLLENYFVQHYSTSNQSEQQSFMALLALEDSELLALLLGDKISEQCGITKLIEKIRFPASAY